MFQNQFNLLSLFGFLMLCVSLFALAVAWQFYQEMREYESVADYWGRVGFLSFGIVWLILSVFLVLKQVWVRVVFIIVFALCILIWTAILFFALSRQDRIMPVMIGISTLIYGAMTFGILFLNNKFVISHFDEQYQLREEREDILDF